MKDTDSLKDTNRIYKQVISSWSPGDDKNLSELKDAIQLRHETDEIFTIEEICECILLMPKEYLNLAPSSTMAWAVIRSIHDRRLVQNSQPGINTKLRKEVIDLLQKAIEFVVQTFPTCPVEIREVIAHSNHREYRFAKEKLYVRELEKYKISTLNALGARNVSFETMLVVLNTLESSLPLSFDRAPLNERTQVRIQSLRSVFHQDVQRLVRSVDGSGAGIERMFPDPLILGGTAEASGVVWSFSKSDF